MAIERVASVAERFLSQHSFNLIVAPAVADFEFECRRGARMAPVLAVLNALAGAVYEDLTADLSSTMTFLGLAFFPGCYYAFLFIICLPVGLHTLEFDRTAQIFLLGVVLISSSSAVVCYWPERLPRRKSVDNP
jgi:hypothetical protein